MLPPFEIRGLRWPAEDPESTAREGYLHDAWPEIRLESHEEYDSLIREHPKTTLSYLDEDDGEIITVGSAEELYTRVEDVFPTQGSAIFDLLLPRTDPDYQAALDIWQRRFVDVSHAKAKAKGKALAGLSESEPSTAKSGLLVDIGDNDTSYFSHSETGTDVYTPQSPLLTAFSNELERIMQEAARPGEGSPLRAPSPPPSPPVPSIQPANRNGEMLAQSLREIVRDIGRVALELRGDVPPQARPTIGAFNNALTTALGAFTSQLQSVALDAANAAKNAAQVTRDMDTSELEAHGRKVRELAETIGHMAVQGAGVAREEVEKALGSGSAESLGDPVEADTQTSTRVMEQSRAGSYRATVETDDEEEREEEEDDASRRDRKGERRARAKSVWEMHDNLEGTGIIPVAGEVPSSNDANRIPSPAPPLSMPHEPVSLGELDNQSCSSAPAMPPLEPPAEGPPSYFPHAGYPMQSEDVGVFHPLEPANFGYNHQHPSRHPRSHSSRFPPHFSPDCFGQGLRMPAPPLPPPPPPRIPHSPAPISPPSPPFPRHQIPPYPRRHNSSHWGSPSRGWVPEEARSRRSGMSPPEWPLRREDSDVSMRDVGSHEEEYTPSSEGPRDRRVGRDDRNRDPEPAPRPIRRSSTMRDGARRGGQPRDGWAITQPPNRAPSFGGSGRPNPIASMPPTPGHPRLRQFPSLANFRSPIPPRLSRDLNHRASVSNFRSEDLDALVNPFLTPPRQPSPSKTVPPAPEPPASAVSIPGEWPHATVVIPPPPPPAPMSAFRESPTASPVVERGVGPIAPAEPARRQQTRPREPNEHHSPSTNPFLERRRMRENRLGLDARNWGGQSRNRRTIIPPIPDQEGDKIDKCVAALIEMGYSDDGGESAIERLRVYAQIVEGNVENAVEMLEEEREAWQRRQ
ncbi:unnamed protein product [Tuber melanosporum]|uniref:(Perigord truffle) hypothetical protein n=1 Tax=Tuber melanosporum (strain Mel28) TaxID=656061 RepID=D5GGM0_TUBMM|nr:uncharacterized protein GSTUM_00007415001 [Tuber melanosporum]CAZ83642.1 unnamed protein product [Tuber melanosporum]